MNLNSITLDKFRNYSKQKFGFSKEITLIVGNNATGKTNILEACYLLATGNSFRARKIEEMILFDSELARVSGVVKNSSDQKTELEIMLTRGEIQGKRVAKRRYSVDGAAKRKADFCGRLVVVLFRPEDLRIVLGSPSKRREFMDEVLMQVDREYHRSMVSYGRALVRRNRLLDVIRDEGVPRTQLAFWDQLLIKHGRILTAKRESFIVSINSHEERVDSFQVVYDSSVISEVRLEKYARQEVAAGYTLVGPHKDDFMIVSKSKGKAGSDLGRDLALYGSRGEQRLAVLWLKLAELSFVSEKINEKPVLLLDDIFSELDEEHRDMVFKVIAKQQTIITTTGLDLVKSKYRKKSELIRLS